MCGRFSLTEPKEAVEEMFGIADLAPYPPRYNIAPTQPVLVVTAGEAAAPGANHPARRALLVRWGLWPAWVKDPREFPLIFNARTESVLEKPAFRTAMRHRRALVPASGFYEWKRPPKRSKAKPQAYWVRPKAGGSVAFAGLMETWSAPDGTEVDTACILTTAANAEFSAIHERMPLVIAPEDFSRWLDCRSQEPRDVIDLMQPAAEGLLEAIPVSDRVNKVA
ncbi:MAG TPA: SOS response-associated peptidase, partial [Pararhizobium sp.]|nr:SOS response-associated peptidase [Pararhizobium sp.]